MSSHSTNKQPPFQDYVRIDRVQQTETTAEDYCKRPDRNFASDKIVSGNAVVSGNADRAEASCHFNRGCGGWRSELPAAKAAVAASASSSSRSGAGGRRTEEAAASALLHERGGRGGLL